MKSIYQHVLIVSLILLAGMSTASANGSVPGCDGHGGGGSVPTYLLPNYLTGHTDVPEIDAAGVLPALTLLGGAMGLINARRKGKVQNK